MRGVRSLLLLVVLAPSALAGSLTRDAAIGGAVGGALGGAVGAELGGREGAIVGAGIGAAAGTAINTQGYQRPPPPPIYHDHDYPSHGHPEGRFCPPGQAKKGRC